MKNGYRTAVSSFALEWNLPDGYYIVSLRFPLWHTHPVISVYLCYEAKEMIEGKDWLITAGYTGDGDNFQAALAVAKEKVDAALAKERERSAYLAKNPPKVAGLRPDPKPTGPLPQIDGLKFDL